jgi:UDP-glucose 4-epimerase
VRAIVTGGAGFIGSHIVDALVARGDEVTVLDDLSTGRRENLDERARLVEAHLAEAGPVFAEVRPEVCFHLAAQADVRVSVERPDFDAEINLLGTIRVLEAARMLEAQVIFASTGGAIYGECDAPAAEESPRRPLAPYGASKLAAEEYLATYNRLHGTQHVSLRYSNVYGPRQDPHGEAGVVAIFFGRLGRGDPLRIFGNGRQTRDYVYVGDVAAAFAAAGRADATGALNVSTGVETNLREVAAHLKLRTQQAPARAGEIARSCLDPSAAGRALGWRAQMPLGEGLRHTLTTAAA